MTNAKVYQGFRDDKKAEKHWSTVISLQTLLDQLLQIQ